MLASAASSTIWVLAVSSRAFAAGVFMPVLAACAFAWSLSEVESKSDLAFGLVFESESKPERKPEPESESKSESEVGLNGFAGIRVSPLPEVEGRLMLWVVM